MNRWNMASGNATIPSVERLPPAKTTKQRASSLPGVRSHADSGGGVGWLTFAVHAYPWKKEASDPLPQAEQAATLTIAVVVHR
ncbi:hypothetical protein HPB50_015682 [Hyalomma asiaticum]|uniref:Uncharacterized protein n=1 Tax=Hyalomma asiaticum TaxID=266040 RepID=A0ACB7SWH2_HYAAI|nr:hypothetical protein HPB50_015682 [Hyalomma asiaticum]